MSSSTSPPINEQAVLSKYKELQSECHGLVSKITELEQDRNEHKLVEQTLAPIDDNRRAFRLVGGVLVERTVSEVLPSVRSNRENLDSVIASMEQRLKDRQKETAEWKAKYNIRTAEEAEATRQRQGVA
uniref:Prefoldin subunit 2 n=1 Tax=Eucampia antarctica TaxID=49252 RepID=A0A7S2R7M0_9STRA|mmetsp:Transcript_18141/g.17516  ORF Transcript_18141/g.17516 Transcript_18141/m.17516 type:complete len:129 (+) Transcript_18141:98-484(+)|eukprot:CAMPEP_0197834474 /NCGR_PEP_ID=MMETSP1437-20131217/22481_1 /TAXON_ID=49252 ORGANISM="Eucampia antarctica, Strain CCMP1452" /NCGR_SAMPLE_ID=MMETSP1437 /ASSEMBLY_ACC=CAM_ASM_001096 /LENGTH=128 /DNA_ID=CAMNT_0043439165 /DNA_START=77 /DNA_END=463 /DNA_ORIENTATION=-